jgi:hypothetical protein
MSIELWILLGLVVGAVGIMCFVIGYTVGRDDESLYRGFGYWDRRA